MLIAKKKIQFHALKVKLCRVLIQDAPQRLRVGYTERDPVVRIGSQSSCTIYEAEENSDFA
jgi:hypothetical protein